jgi:phosphohistidine phosphatase
MNLFVVRHAIAEDAQPGQDDASRRLTDEGERKLRLSVRGMRELGWRFDRVLTSPWTRAAHTAELLGPISRGKPIPTELLCQTPAQELLAMIVGGTEAPREGRGTAVVGHEPWLGELVGLLTLGEPRAGHGLELKKAGVAWLEGTVMVGGMKLRALLPPKITRGLAD